MKKFKIILLLLPFLSFQLKCLSQDLDYAKRVIQKLSSPEFKGRGYVENGDKLTADFISNEFKNLGLSPVAKKSYFQKFNISANTFPNRMSVKIDGNDLIAGTDYIIESSSPSINGKFRIVKITRNQLNNDAELISLVKKAGNSFILIDNGDRKNEKPDVTGKRDEYIKIKEKL